MLDNKILLVIPLNMQSIKATEHADLQTAVENVSTDLYCNIIGLEESANLDLFSLAGVRIEIDFTQSKPKLTAVIATTEDVKTIDVTPSPL